MLRLLCLLALAACTPDLGTTSEPLSGPHRMLTTPGYGSLPYYVRLETDRPLAMFLGEAGHAMVPGDLVGVGWMQGFPAPVGWAEVAVMQGTPNIGATPLRVVGTLDITDMVTWGAPGVQMVRDIPLAYQVGATDSLWLVFAAWRPPGWTDAPMLVGSNYREPIQGSTVLELDEPGWKPSTAMQWNWASVFGTTLEHPIAAAVILP